MINNKKVITGSFHWSPTAAHPNEETLLLIHSHQLAKHFTREMNRLWRGAELGVPPGLGADGNSDSSDNDIAGTEFQDPLSG